MRLFLFFTIAYLLCATDATGVTLPEKWERLTCKVTTDSLIGTAFILRYKDQIVAVTNDHVVTPGKSTFHLKLRAISTNMPPEDTVLAENERKEGIHKVIPNAGMYYTDSTYDIAFVRLSNVAGLVDVSVLPESLVGSDSMIVPGRKVFFLGYPAGLSGRTSNTPLVRTAIVSGELEHRIILDGNIFGGSSGSPVFLDADPSNGVKYGYFIGVVSQEHLRPALRLDGVLPLFAENIGLGVAIKVSCITSALDKWIATW